MLDLEMYLFYIFNLSWSSIATRGVASMYARTPVRTAEIWEKNFSL